ncbi:hypothetical protein [Micromonospora echinofusca]|uniref:Uncharacterized protein n=1 Tax=Micromonospora echinofusca TaxID=47858 RepID=A0ABS3VX57_MICEH|nr:hypothetical protein [Micromonospora echinofusca]MBO4209131.1 hypothetical protein [Micromonospora echinofusca]
MVSPDKAWVQWLVIVAALVQSVAAVIQVSQGRRHRRSDTPREAAKPGSTRPHRRRSPPFAFDHPVMRAGLLAVVLGIIMFYVAPVAAEVDLDNGAEDFKRPEDFFAVFVVFAAPTTAMITIMWAITSIFDREETSNQRFAHLLTAIVAAALIFAELSLLPS